MRTLVIAACLLACTGCIPVSLHPLSEGEQDTFESKFVGVWGGEEGGFWELSAGNSTKTQDELGRIVAEEFYSYDVYYTESGKTSDLTGRLANINGVTFIDLAPQREFGSRLGNEDIGGEFLELMLSWPMHTWMKIEIVDDKLRMLPVDLEYINDVLEKDPAALPHISTGNDEWPIITASTEQLRAFIAANMHNEGFFGEMGDLTRIGNPQTRRSGKGIQTGNTNYDQQYRNQTTATPQTYEQAEKK